MKSSPALALLLLGACGMAHADGQDTTFYLEGSVGQASTHYNSFSQNAVDQGVIDGSTTGLSLVAGSGLNDNFAVEIGYHDYGSPTTSQQTGFAVNQCPKAFACPHVSAITAEAVGRFPIITDLTGEVLGGIQAWNVGSPGSTVIGKSSGDSFVYGLRVRHDFHDQYEGWSADVTYEYSNFSTSEVRIGLRYTF